jgi:Flp pilus assembly protein TadG
MKKRERLRSARLSLVGSQHGAAAVELALLLPILIILIFGAIEFGVLMYDQQVLTNASREGARAGIVQKDTPVTVAEIQQIVSNYASGRLITFGSGGTAPETDVSPGTGDFGSDVTVTATYGYEFFVLGSLIPGFDGQRLMTAHTTMRHE